MTATDRLNAMQARCDAAAGWKFYYHGGGATITAPDPADNGRPYDVGRMYWTEDAQALEAARTDLPATIAALRAVLDLHLPVLDILPWLPRHPAYCGECSDDEVVTYPCPTVAAITEALA